MSATAYILLIGDENWQLGCCAGEEVVWTEIAPEAEADEGVDQDQSSQLTRRARAVAEALDQQNPGGGRRLILALPTSWCLSATISIEDLPRRDRRQAMTYRLEEQLPVSAEAIVSDFITLGNAALGVAVETNRLQNLVAALEQEGVDVEAVVPGALLALQGWLESSSADAKTADVISWQHNGGIDLWQLKRDRPVRWHNIAADGDAAGEASQRLRRQLAWQDLQSRNGAIKFLPLGFSDELENTAAEHAELIESEQSPDSRDTAARFASRLQAGRVSPWIDLRHGPLQKQSRFTRLRPALDLAIVGLMVLLLAAVLSLEWAGYQYRQVAKQQTEIQQRLFRETFPDQSVPVGVRSRMQSEYRRLRGISGRSSLPDRPEATAILAQALGALPETIRFRLLDLSVEEGRLRLEGEARSHGDADQIAAALRDLERFNVPPPRTRALSEEGVAFTIRANREENVSLGRAED